MNFRRQTRGHDARTAAAKASRHSDILPAIHAERNRKSLHRSAEPCLPQLLAAAHIESRKRRSMSPANAMSLHREQPRLTTQVARLTKLFHRAYIERRKLPTLPSVPGIRNQSRFTARLRHLDNSSSVALDVNTLAQLNDETAVPS